MRIPDTDDMQTQALGDVRLWAFLSLKAVIWIFTFYIDNYTG
jgi:hypothetical protein